MVISSLCSSKKSPAKKRALEIKKKLLKERALPRRKTNKVENGDKKMVQICTKRKGQKYSSIIEANSLAMLRAKEFQANLPSQYPSFVKYMLPSHVTGGFWLSFPRKFCDSHLPKHDDTVVLVDENDKEFATKYLIDKNGLSGGWRGFSIAHSLLENDVLVFQLIQPCKFKVYIVRENCLNEIATTLLEIHARPVKSGTVISSIFSFYHKQDVQPDFLFVDIISNDEDEEMKICEAREERYLEPPVLEIHPDEKQEAAMLMPSSDHGPVTNQCGNDSDNGSEVLEGIRFSESRVEFQDVKDFSGFNIVVDGLIIDLEVEDHIRIKYYDLCRTQNSYLHDHLLGGLNVKLAAGVIMETVMIADGIKASNISTPANDLETWDRSLKAFECFGMGVGFLRERISKLANMSCELKKILASKEVELAEAKEEMLNLEKRVLEGKQVIENLDSEIKALTKKDAIFEVNFKALATAPW